MIELSVHLACDEETGRWYVRESQVPGLWLEAPSALELIRRIAEAAPELVELNAVEIFGGGVIGQDDGTHHAMGPADMFNAP